jgi:hypothetical protein
MAHDRTSIHAWKVSVMQEMKDSEMFRNGLNMPNGVMMVAGALQAARDSCCRARVW